MPIWRFRPLSEASGARPNEYGNASAGPPTLAPPFAPYHMAPQAAHPSGGPSETKADVDNIIEESATPVSDSHCSHIPHVLQLKDCSVSAEACPWERTTTDLAQPPRA